MRWMTWRGLSAQALDRGKARTEQEKAAAMQENNAKAAAPRIAELAAAVMEACSRGEYKGAAQHYKVGRCRSTPGRPQVAPG
jgi:hypothetical protein